MVQKLITNDDIMDAVQELAQQTRTGFEHVERELREIRQHLSQHDLQLTELRVLAEGLVNQHAAYINDIADILDRVQRLERQRPHVTKSEVRELQRLLQKVVDWALKTSKATGVPLQL